VTLRNAQPVRFSPTGLSDALDASNVFPGAMSELTNLIPDITTKNVWTCRPAAIKAVDFKTVIGDFDDVDFNPGDFSTGFSTANPGFISVIKVIGTRVYGMIASSANAGHDQPFIYDMVAQTFIPVSGITAANTPVSPPTSGPWTPPTMDLIGSKMIVTHPGYTGAGGNYFGWFDISTFASPAWNAGNTAVNALPAVPSGVKQFGERAYYIVNFPSAPSVIFTDVLDPLTVTLGTNVITFGDNVPLVALGALPLNSQLTGGIIQSLIVFKQSAQMWEITGDAASTSNPLTLNEMSVAVTCLSPNGIVNTPKGLAFIAADGIRLIGFNSAVSDPVGFAGNGVTVPFIQIAVPSRAAMACNADTVRIALETTGVAGVVNTEYWYTISRGCWSGPHTCDSALMQAYSNTFVVTLTGVNAVLWQSDSVQSGSSTFIENGTQLMFDWQTAVLPDNQQMNENNLLECTINMVGSSNNSTYGVQFITSDGTVLDTVSVSLDSGGAKWGTAIWGGFLWSTSVTGLSTVPVNPHRPIVFRKMSILLTGNSYLGFKVGDMFTRMEQLGYLQQVAS
jgi:hypothetical protein